MIGVLVRAGVVVGGGGATRGGYATAPYNGVREDSGIEVRDYLKLVLVETPTSPSGDGADGSFGRPFHFITGRNGGSRKISMTTPAFMSGVGTNRPMGWPAAMAGELKGLCMALRVSIGSGDVRCRAGLPFP